jgi:hypothetical protein
MRLRPEERGDASEQHRREKEATGVMKRHAAVVASETGGARQLSELRRARMAEALLALVTKSSGVHLGMLKALHRNLLFSNPEIVEAFDLRGTCGRIRVLSIVL